MSLIQAIILGIIQGLTEFIPISSTAHLTIAGKMMGLISPQNPEQWTAFMAVIQLGTLAAVFVYFWNDVVQITRAFFDENLRNRRPLREQSLDSRLGWLILVGSVPIGVIGIALKKIIEGNLTKDLYVISGSLIVLAILLYIAERVASFKKELGNITFWDALVIGIAQSIALIPGSSRSGTTITAGLFMGLTRETAARFSFLLSIPAILSSGMLELVKSLPVINSGDALNLTVSTIASAIFGYLSIAYLIRFLRTHTTLQFIIYRIALGILLIILVNSGVVSK